MSVPVTTPFDKELAQRNAIVFMPFGSSIYGTSLPTSDTDYKAVFLPSEKEILLSRTPGALNLKTNHGDDTNTANDVDMEMYSLSKYLELLCQAQTVALDMLFTKPLHNGPIWQAIVDNRYQLLSKKCGAAIGYARAQAERYSLRGARMLALEQVLAVLKTKPSQTDVGDVVSEVLAAATDDTRRFINTWREEAPNLPGGYLQHLDICGKRVGFTAHCKFAVDVYTHQLAGYGARAEAAKHQGADWKAMYHALRISAQTVELLQMGKISFPRPEAAYLLKVRRGELPVAEVSEAIEKGLEDVLAAQAKSTLPDEPNRAFADEFVANVYRDVVKGKL